jgi:hypothetical protein
VARWSGGDEKTLADICGRGSARRWRGVPLSAGLDDRPSDTLFTAGLSVLPAFIGASVVLWRWSISADPIGSFAQ